MEIKKLPSPHCEGCGGYVERVPGRGRPRRFCNACRPSTYKGEVRPKTPVQWSKGGEANGATPAFRLMPQMFRSASRGRLPKSVGAAKRSSPRLRGYDAKWDRLSVAWRKANPLCAECEKADLLRQATVVDHIIPVADREDLRYSPDNLQSLCDACHNGLKRDMEREARSLGDLGVLQAWCKDVSSRPPHLRRGKL